MMLAGLGGTGLIPGRSLDRLGVAYFRYALSNDLTDGLRLFGVDLSDEHGVELFYTAWSRRGSASAAISRSFVRGTIIANGDFHRAERAHKFLRDGRA
jgi:hypothetical protein